MSKKLKQSEILLPENLDIETGEVKTKTQIEQEEYPWRTPRNAAIRGFDAEVNNQPSMTVPDQSMSITEIMRRFASGLSLSGARVPSYESDGEDFEAMPDLRKMDLAEIQQLKESNDAELSAIRQEMNTKEKQLRELARKNELDKMVNAEIEKRTQQQKTKEEFDSRNPQQ